MSSAKVPFGSNESRHGWIVWPCGRPRSWYRTPLPRCTAGAPAEMSGTISTEATERGGPSGSARRSVRRSPKWLATRCSRRREMPPRLFSMSESEEAEMPMSRACWRRVRPCCLRRRRMRWPTIAAALLFVCSVVTPRTARRYRSDRANLAGVQRVSRPAPGSPLISNGEPGKPCVANAAGKPALSDDGNRCSVP